MSGSDGMRSNSFLILLEPEVARELVDDCLPFTLEVGKKNMGETI